MIAGVIISVLFILIMLIFYIYKESIGYKVTKYSFKSSKIAKDNVKIALISDLHNVEHGEKNNKLLNELISFNPDFVCFAGDMINACKDKHFDFSNTIEFIAEIKKRWPVYYGVGNHEERLYRKQDKFPGAYEKLVKQLDAIETPLLLNEKKSIDEFSIDIYGLNLEHKYYRKFVTRHIPDDYLNSIFGNVDKDRFSILLAHNPEHFIKYSEWGPDLVLSGHVHGGIVNLPFLGGVISPALRLFPKYDAGLFTNNNTSMILSRGAGSHSIPIRINNKAEIIFIDISR